MKKKADQDVPVEGEQASYNVGMTLTVFVGAALLSLGAMFAAKKFK